MRHPAEFRCELPAAELFTSLAAGPLPLGLVVRRVSWSLYHDVYLDTSDQSLAAAGVTCRVRTGGGGRVLSLGIARPGSPDAGAIDVLEAEQPAGDLVELLRGDTRPARRLRSLIDPARLEPRVELAVERVTRDSTRAWRLPGWFAFLYDRVTVRRGGLARQFQELKVRRRLGGRPRLEELAQALEAQHGMHPQLQTKLQRAQALLRQMEQERQIRRLESGRAVAVIALDEGRIALVRDGGERQLPIVSGAGEQAVRYGLAEWFGSQVGELVLLGHAPPALDRPSLEVWLARRLRGGLEPLGERRIEWMPVDDLVRAVRTSAIRHPATVAAFGVAARSALFPEWSPAQAAHAPPPPARAPEPGQLLDADASLLEFDLRVLAMAEDERTPLLERLRYLAIVSANLDELYMGVGREIAPERVHALLTRQQACVVGCLARLADHGYRLRRWAELDDGEHNALRLRFRNEFFPLLTPRAITVSPGHPFPVIPALTLSLAVTLEAEATGPIHFAYLRLPAALPRFVELADGGGLVPVEEIVRANLGLLYPDRVVEEAALFRVTRKGDLNVEDAEAGDLLQAIEEELDQRALNPVVRLEVEAGASRRLREMLVQELRFEGGHGGAALRGLVVHDAEGLMALGDLRRLAILPVAGGLFPPFTPRDPLDATTSLWERLRAGDLLVHRPYEDFCATVLRLLEEAADDPDVAAIRMTLYRVGERSPVVDALARAARRGKEVAVFVELKASWDEARNIGWVKQLERAGAQVVYGLVGLKNHAKAALVVRREDGAIRRYVHVGTGNYNPGTARVYTDFGLLSADPVLGEDLNDFFNQLTGTSSGPRAALRRVIVAPEHLLPFLLERIGHEAALASGGGVGRIRAKLNGIDDPEIIQALYEASRAGVEIDLVVRGLCTLRPGVPGLSERIRVRSLVGRFLEHGRIYHFGNGGSDEYLIGSADWRVRNLRHRVELVTPVLDAASRLRLGQILTRELADPSAWELGPDGVYHQLHHLAVSDPATAQAAALSASALDGEGAAWAAQS